MLERIERTLSEIQAKLAADDILIKLLCNDSNNALNMSTPTNININDYITLYPVYQIEDIRGSNQNCIVNIVLSDNSNNDNTNDGVIQIRILCNIDKWQLIDNKIRPIQIANRIIKLINNQKFSVSNPIEFATMQELIVSKKLVGYALLCYYTDGSSNLEKF